MSNWRDTILNEFFPNINKLTLVADPDGLLVEQKMALALKDRGFDLIEFTDAIEFRYAYESKYRAIWDTGQYTDLVVILRLQDVALDFLPYDLLTVGRKLAFNLGELFPYLSYPVIAQIDQSLLDMLFAAQTSLALSERMGDNATKDFILRHVFSIAAELITNPVDLLRALLRIHYANLSLPSMLSERLVQVLSNYTVFSTWSLDKIISDEKSFFAFLQERWPIFLTNFNSTNRLKEDSSEYNLQYSGPALLPFDHQDIRIYIDNLFFEGKLTPVKNESVNISSEYWISKGVLSSDDSDIDCRIKGLFHLIEQSIPTKVARYTDWTNFALTWAELSALVHCSTSVLHQTQLRQTGLRLNSIFADWLADNYSSLINIPPANPAMLHHVPRKLAREIEDNKTARVALIVVDGLALDQWVTMRQILQQQDSDLIMREFATFAWIPTLTSVSRQSIFSGKPPLYFPSTINSTNNEEKHWQQFWEGHGLSRLEIAYQRGLGDGNISDILDSIIHSSKTQVLGLVVDKVDKIMHGMQLGSAGMHNQIKLWGHLGFLSTLISKLLNGGYEIWLTADHGNIECEGKGRPSEGVIAETRGERVRVYPSDELRSIVAKDFDFSRKWSSAGLPPDYYPLVTTAHDAFIAKGDNIVGHGGISIEEVIVPFVKIERKIHHG